MKFDGIEREHLAFRSSGKKIKFKSDFIRSDLVRFESPYIKCRVSTKVIQKHEKLYTIRVYTCCHFIEVVTN